MRKFFTDFFGKAGLVSGAHSGTKRRHRIRASASFAIEDLEQRILFGFGVGYTSGLINISSATCSTTPSTGPGSSGPTGGGPGGSSPQPVDYLTGKPEVTITDLQSDGFEGPWGVTRAWYGEPDTGLLGNGWINSSTPYITIRQNGFASSGDNAVVSVFENGANQLNFTLPNSGGAPIASFNNLDHLTYTPSATVDGKKMPGEFNLIDPAGNITTFYDLPRSDGLVDATDTYAQEIATTDSANTDGDAYEFTYGGFASYQDSHGNSIKVVYGQNQYLTGTVPDPSFGRITAIIRTDSVTGKQEQFAYSYQNFTNLSGTADGTTPLITEISLEQRSSSADSWSTPVEYVDYTYYDGATYASNGRFGDLKTATTYMAGVSEPTNTDYYRYAKFLTADEDIYDEPQISPLDDPTQTGGPTALTLGYDPGFTVKTMANSGLSVVVQGASYTRLLAAEGSLSNIESMSLADITPYADNTFSYTTSSGTNEGYTIDSRISFGYESEFPVLSETVGGAGCDCASTNGAGLYSYHYDTSPFVGYFNSGMLSERYYAGQLAQNVWSVKTTETMPDGSKSIVYTNEAGEVMMNVTVSADGVADATYYRYSQSGQVIMTADQSAFSTVYNPSSPATFEDNPDLVGYVDTTGGYTNLSPYSGLIKLTDYGAATTATAESAGDVLGGIKDTAIQQGYDGNLILQTSQNYILSPVQETSNSNYLLASSTTYRNSDGTGEETTQYGYTWYSGTNQIETMTTTSPTIAAGQNGPGSPDISEVIYDTYGRAIWTVDPDGYINYTAYDPSTGAVVETILDVDPTTVTTAPTDVPTPDRSSSLPNALNLTTVYQVDSYGRTTAETDPNGNTTYTVYDDAHHAVFTLPGATETFGAEDTLTTTGPIQLTRTQIPYAFTQNGITFTGTYDETISFTGTVVIDGGTIELPSFIRGNSATTGTANVLNLVGNGSTADPQFQITALSRVLYNNEAQAVESDAYFSITNGLYMDTVPGSPYSGSSSNNSASGNFHATLFKYDELGRQNEVVNPTGTITQTVYDAWGRPIETLVGTNDGWSTGTYVAASNNLVEVSSSVYDGGGTDISGVGDGNLTEMITYPGGDAAPRGTLMYYDWRDRLTATKNGAALNVDGSDNLANEVGSSTQVGRSIDYTVYDNLSEPVEQAVYVGDGVGVAVANGAVLPPSPELLRSQVVENYDDQGRLYRTQRFDVDQNSGTDIAVGSLTNSTKYYFSVTGYDATGASVGSYTTTATPTSGIPAPALRGETMGSEQMLLAWTDVSGASGYTVYWGTTSGSYSNSTAVGNVTDYTIGSLSPDTTYFFVVVANNGGSASGYSNEVQGSTFGQVGSVAVPDSSFEDYSVGSGVYKYSTDIPSSATPWSFSGNSGIESNGSGFGAATAPDGTQGAFLQSTSSAASNISQSLSLSAGTYALSFFAAQRPGIYSGNYGIEPINVSIDGSSIGIIEPYSNTFVRYGLTFTLSSGGTHTISFSTAINDPSFDDTSFIDDVTLELHGNTFPTALAPSAEAVPSNGQADLNWTGMPGAINYQVNWGTSPTSLTHSKVLNNQEITSTYYDHRGNVIETIAPTGLAMKTQYDGVSRVAMTYTTDGGIVHGVGGGSLPSGWPSSISLSASQSPTGSAITLTWVDGGGYESNTSFDYGATTLPSSPVVALLSPAFASSSLGDSSGNWVLRAETSSGKMNAAYSFSANGLWSLETSDSINSSSAPFSSFTAPSTLFIAAVPTALPWSLASDVSEDVVLDQKAFGYDANSNVIETVDAPAALTLTSGAGAIFSDGLNSDGSLTVYSGGRIYYDATYFDAANRDIADVNVGDNGGSEWLRPSSAPTPSDIVLVTSTTYNAAGYVDTVTDPNGIVNETFYDALGRTASTVADTNDLDSIGLAQTTDYTYDGDNHLLTETAELPDSSVEETAYIYGVTGPIHSNDLLAKVDYPDPTTGAASTDSSNDVSYTYDQIGEQTSMTDRNGVTHDYTYDYLGRVIKDAVDTGSIGFLGYAYDTLGNLIEAVTDNTDDQHLNVDYRTYDAFGNITSDAQEHDANTSGLSTTAIPVTYIYDPSRGDRLVSITYPDGHVISYNYDGNPTAGDESYGTSFFASDMGLDNAISRLSSITDSSGLLQGYAYLGVNNSIFQFDGNSVIHIDGGLDVSTGDGGDTLGLDRFGRVVDESWIRLVAGELFSSATIDQVQYGYDADGNVLYEKNDNLTNQSVLYTYDTLNRLSGFSRGTLNSTNTAISGTPSTTESWGLDNLGNWQGVTTDGTSSTNSFNQQNQETSVGSSSYSPAYDNNGNMTQDQNGNTYTYDAWNRLTGVYDNTDTLVASYSYDALGRRITVNAGAPSPANTTDLFYSKDGQVIEERSEDGSGNPTATQAQYVWNPFYVNNLIERDGIWVEQDANYNVTSISDSSGNILERFVYDPYGGVTIFNAAGTSTIDFATSLSNYNWVYLFQGGRIDATTDIYQFGARDYRSDLGRWLEQDPSGYVNGANTYQFEFSNPVDQSDVTGQASSTTQAGSIGITGGQLKATYDNVNAGSSVGLGTVKVFVDPTINMGGGQSLGPPAYHYIAFDFTAKKSCVHVHWVQLGRRDQYIGDNNREVNGFYGRNAKTSTGSVYEYFGKQFLDAVNQTTGIMGGYLHPTGIESIGFDEPNFQPYQGGASSQIFFGDTYLVITPPDQPAFVALHISWDRSWTGTNNPIYENITLADRTSYPTTKDFLFGYLQSDLNTEIDAPNPFVHNNPSTQP